MEQATLPSLTNALTAQGLPIPHPLFLTPILAPNASQRVPPLNALTATARLRLLSSDITLPHILAENTTPLPPRITDASVASRVLAADTPVQVLEIEDLSRSKWDQVEALEMERKGEMTKGREVIRVVPTPADGGEAPSSASTQFAATPAAANNAASSSRSSGPFKLCLQDFKGTSVYGFELKRVEKIGYPPVMSVGCKIMLRKGCKVARGMVLLEPGTAVVIGGKIEGLDKKWREGREQALRDAIGERQGRREDI